MSMNHWMTRMILMTALPLALSVCVLDAAQGDPDASGDSGPDGSRVETGGVSVGGGDMEKIDLWIGDQPQLRGANVHQARAFDNGFVYDGTMEIEYQQADFDRLAALGANLVNISHPGLYDERAPYLLDTAMQQNLDDLLAMIEAADMFAVIAFRTGPGRNELTFVRDELAEGDAYFTEAQLDESVWTSTSAQSAWVQMWRYTAQRYANSDIVVGYDLMVEPNSNDVVTSDSFDGWDAEAFESRYGGTSYDWNEMYPQIVDAIREVDANTPILIGANGYSGAQWIEYVEPVNDERVVYTVHQYEPFTYTHQGEDEGLSYPGNYDIDWDGSSDRFDSDYLDSLHDPVRNFANRYQVPIVFNEMGAVRHAPNVVQYLGDQYDLLEAEGWSSAMWMHYSVNGHPGGDEFNYYFGTNAGNHQDISSNELLSLLESFWSRNTSRPSNVSF